MRLFINIDHVATVRQARRTDEPDPVRAAVLAELGGADGITVHLREDRRHIQDRDVRLLAQTLRTPMNLELATVDEIVDLACELSPHQVTVVPERRQEVTTEGGLDVTAAGARDRLVPVLARLRSAGIRTSLFIDPDTEATEASADLGVEAVEFHTGEYALARGAEVDRQLRRLAEATEKGRSLGLAVHAGHGLTYDTVAPVAAFPEVVELNIGHFLIGEAIFRGLEPAIREMRQIMDDARA